MIGRIRGARDPFWDDGVGARRTLRNTHIEGAIALSIAIIACGLTAAMWLRSVVPLTDRLGLS
jgi:hypothetical protein